MNTQQHRNIINEALNNTNNIRRSTKMPKTPTFL